MDSIGIGHVPPPDPDYFWDFVPGQKRILIERYASLELLTIQQDGYDPERVEITMYVGGRAVTDWLNMNRPCVALRLPHGEPYVTLTLRKVTYENVNGNLPVAKAYLQVTVNPKAPQGKRTDLNG